MHIPRRYLAFDSKIQGLVSSYNVREGLESATLLPGFRNVSVEPATMFMRCCRSNSGLLLGVMIHLQGTEPYVFIATPGSVLQLFMAITLADIDEKVLRTATDLDVCNKFLMFERYCRESGDVFTG